MVEKGERWPPTDDPPSDLDLQTAVDRAAFSWGKLFQQNREAFLELLARQKQKDLSDKEARNVYARLNSRRKPNTDK